MMSRAADGVGFYERFFKGETFLSPGRTSVYSGKAYLRGMGIDDPALFAGRRVLEIGAGRGRVTLQLEEHGMLASTTEYVVVEPTSAIDRIAEALPPGRATLVRSPLEGLRERLQPASFDTILCLGVMPHLDESLRRSFEAVAHFLRPGGAVMVNAFFNGDRLRLSQELRRYTVGHPARTSAAALGQTLLQKASYGLHFGAPRLWYHRHFPFSFQKSFRGIFDQCREYFGVPNYDISLSYEDYIEAMASAGLGLAELYPTSLSLKAVKGAATCRLGGIRPGATVAVVGRDWRGRAMARRLGLREASLKATPEEAVGHDQVVIAYDYTRGPSYIDAVSVLVDHGYRLGETVFIHQMLGPSKA
ncbi:class I SAM-dependent methyltransferase (plasmid) [Azospirillum oryzae]|uniref:Class I SAM-dependent methyltransferase n=2 Tax=Azospirillum oryzae TaxID=286727 RepID=A0A6N1ADF0_9PROT|nr:class I SAM-dependent methyltransferase [Azospirillum oryzae]QKS49108.1 class I SAM-dependent methyltransferase [Azospirillum oryzae]